MTSDRRPLTAWTRPWTRGSGVPLVLSVETISALVSRAISLSWTGAVAVMPVPVPLRRVSPIWVIWVTWEFWAASRLAPPVARLSAASASAYAWSASPWPSVPILSAIDAGSASRSVAAR